MKRRRNDLTNKLVCLLIIISILFGLIMLVLYLDLRDRHVDLLIEKYESGWYENWDDGWDDEWYDEWDEDSDGQLILNSHHT